MIRQATKQDFEEIYKIRQSLGLKRENLTDTEYRRSIEKNGFLLFSELERTEFENDLEKIFLVAEEEGKIVGYIRIDTEQELKDESHATWIRADVKPFYSSHPHADIGGIAVLPGNSHKGIGSCLLEAAEDEVRKKGVAYLFSFVVSAPIINKASIVFHEKHGFERIAIISVEELFELKNYESILYGKRV